MPVSIINKHTPASLFSADAMNGSRYVDEQEADYDDNCTALYRFMEERRFDDAITQIQEHPVEALTWISRFRPNDKKVMRWRLLPLHASCVFKAPVALIDALITAYPDAAQMKDDQEMLPLHLACRNGASKGIILLLLDTFPGSLDIEDRKGRTPLFFLESSKNANSLAVKIAVQDFVSQRKAKAEVKLATKKTEAPKEESPSVISDALKTRSEVDYAHRTILFRQILKKDWEGASIRCGVAPEEAGTFIVTKGFKGDLRFLPLHKASVLQPSEEVIDKLIKAFPEGPELRDQDGWLPLHCACFYGACQAIIEKLLLAYPKGAHLMDSEGRLALHYACLKGASVDVIKSLLSFYPKAAQRKDDEGRLPIHHAASKSAAVDVVTVLIRASAKGSASKDDQGRLPIHHACRKNASVKLIKALLKSYAKGAQVKDDQDKLPIHYACQIGASTDVISVLLASNPYSINSKNGFGHTPLVEARATRDSGFTDSAKIESVISLLEKFTVENKHLIESDADKANAVLKAEMSELSAMVQSLERALESTGKKEKV